MRKAIVTIAIGASYQRLFRLHALPTWRAYARRHGYELVCLDQPIDESERARSRSPAWQKLLVLGRPELAAYDTVVWLDTDVVINHHLAPCIAASVPEGRLGICENTELPDVPLFTLMRRRLDELNDRHLAKHGLVPGRNLYDVSGFDNPPARIFNTGVMALDRLSHREFLERVYSDYEDKGLGTAFEQAPLSYEIGRGAVPFHVMDAKFNVIYRALAVAFGHVIGKPAPVFDGRIALLAAVFSKVWFLHFAGRQDLMEDLRYLRIDRLPFTLNLHRMKALFAKHYGSDPATPVLRPSP